MWSLHSSTPVFQNLKPDEWRTCSAIPNTSRVHQWTWHQSILRAVRVEMISMESFKSRHRCQQALHTIKWTFNKNKKVMKVQATKYRNDFTCIYDEVELSKKQEVWTDRTSGTRRIPLLIAPYFATTPDVCCIFFVCIVLWI